MGIRSTRMLAMQAVAVLCVSLGYGSAAEADLYVYQLPGGTRIVTDHAINNRDYRLIRRSRTAHGMGALVAGRSVHSAVSDPSAYDRLIRRTATRHQVDVALVKAVMHVESAFDPNAISHKGALGLMQLMPDTARRYGVQDAFDPVQNVRAGVRYLKDLHKMFNSDTRLVVAAYNAGENAVKRYKGVPPYDETRDYVRKVMHVHSRYRAADVRANGAETKATTPTVRATADAGDSKVAQNGVASPTIVPVADSHDRQTRQLANNL